ncbi:MAG: DUF1993 domain-containing protein [Pseudohongiellaceae bacterium]
MSQNLYAASIPVFIRALKNLAGILDKGAAFAVDHGMDEKVVTGWRLYPNMFPLTRQVQIACDVVKGAGARLAGVEIPSYPDNEVSFAELRMRVEKTISFLNSLQEGQFAGAAEKQIKLKAGNQELEFRGDSYLQSWVLPNLYFHVATAYNLLRGIGVELGKGDFLGRD